MTIALKEQLLACSMRGKLQCARHLCWVSRSRKLDFGVWVLTSFESDAEKNGMQCRKMTQIIQDLENMISAERLKDLCVFVWKIYV